ncbi:MAG TPA: helix-turn-helix domain-containing protein [Planctomycetota bacterium]|nr:helix-turn-helix domain-containing protein [Planctomycetota bacterium]
MAATQSDSSEALNNALERFAEAAGPDINAFFQRAEKLLIIFALNKERGVKLRAAKILGINRVTLDRKLVEYTIHVKRGKGVVPEGTGDDGDGESEESAEDGPARLVTA